MIGRLACWFQRLPPPDQWTDSQGEEVGEMVLVGERPLRWPGGRARGVVDDPQEFVIADQNLSDTNCGHHRG